MKLNDLFQTFYNTPRQGIYCLINHKNKRVYISHSYDMCTALSSLLKKIQDKTSLYKQLIKDASNLEFLLLENINNYDRPIDIEMKIVYFVKHYKHLGYELYNTKYKFQNFKVSISVNEEIDRVYVQLVSRIYKKLIVGIFDNMFDAELFATEFENMDIIIPVYAINKYTREWFIRHA